MIEAKQVAKVFRTGKGKDDVRAVDGVSFRCEPGRVFALLGPNGSGKTTLLRMISTLMSPDVGELRVSGFDCARESEEVRKRIGFLTGSAGLHEKLSGRETLEFFGKLHGISSEVLKAKIAEMVEEFDLGEFIDRATGKLSMGQKQRIMIARTLIHDPEVVIFDEATTGLDVLAAKGLIDIIRACKDAGKTVLFSTHIMGEVALLADDVTVLHKGRQIYSGTIEELKESQNGESMEEKFISLLENADVVRVKEVASC
ncbi:MAG: ABC transporter ATP-binding protein [Akkermansiaceae bacterium]